MDSKVMYRADSVFTSKTMWANLAALMIAILGLPQLRELFGDNTDAVAMGVTALLNIGLRWMTVRPVALVPPGDSKPVAVEKLP